MTNDQRRKSIQEIKDALLPLNSDKLMASLRFNFLNNPYRNDLNEKELAEAEELRQKISDLNNKITPLYNDLRLLQVKYVVEYDGEAYQNGMLTTIPNKKIFYLSTNCAIDSYKQTPDYADQEVWNVLNELKDYIYMQEYSQFTIQHIKKL
jgi:hypothetical protein